MHIDNTMMFVNDQTADNQPAKSDSEKSDTDPECTDADDGETRGRSNTESSTNRTLIDHIEDAHEGMKALLQEYESATISEQNTVPLSTYDPSCPHTAAISKLSKRIVQILHSKSASSTNLAGMVDDEQQTMYRLEITMGLNIPGSGKVTDVMFAEFVQDQVSGRLDFCTIIDAVGWWKGQQEKVKILYMEMPYQDLLIRKPIFEEIAINYKMQFKQDAVLVSQLETRFSLV